MTKPDYLAHSVRHLLDLLDTITAKGAPLRILDMEIDTSTARGKLLWAVLGEIAEFERQIMLERQREGIAKAKAGEVQAPTGSWLPIVALPVSGAKC